MMIPVRGRPRSPLDPSLDPGQMLGDELYSMMAGPIPGGDPSDPPPSDPPPTPTPPTPPPPQRDRPSEFPPPWTAPDDPPGRDQPYDRSPSWTADPNAPSTPYANSPSTARRYPGSALGNQQYFAGFNFGREQNRETSAKDTFAYGASQGAQDLRWRNSQTSAAWFDQYVRPALEAEGYTVHAVEGDKALISTRENPEGTWIDWVQGIDGDNPMLAWQDQSYGGDPGGGSGGGSPSSSGSGLPDGIGRGVSDPLLGQSLSSDDTLAKLLAEIQRIINGDGGGLLAGAIEAQLNRGR